jgi:hypothetical protein
LAYRSTYWPTGKLGVWVGTCIINISRVEIVKKILAMNGTIQNTLETIEILRTNEKETSVLN